MSNPASSFVTARTAVQDEVTMSNLRTEITILFQLNGGHKNL